MARGKKRAQSITEYLIILAAIIGAVLIARQVVKQHTEYQYNNLAGTMGAGLGELNKAISPQ